MPIETTSLLGLAIPAFVGAATALVAGVPLEHYKRHRDRQGAAAVLVAEISAQIHISEETKSVETFRAFHAKLKSGVNITLPSGLYTAPPEYGPIFEKQIDKLGLLPPPVSARVVEFYGYLIGARTSIRNLVNGAFDGRPDETQMKAAFVQTGLSSWDRATKLADTLIPELHALADESWPLWRPFRNAWALCRRLPRDVTGTS